MLDEAMDGGRQHRWLEALVSRLLIGKSDSSMLRRYDGEA